MTGVFAGVMLASGVAFGQDTAPAAIPRPETRTMGDWMVRCYQVKNANPCDVFQELASKTSQQRVMSFSLAFSPPSGGHLLQITVPLEVAIPKGLVIEAGSYKSPVLKYRLCNREGCFVQIAADNAMVEALKSASGAKIDIVSDSGKALAINMSLTGFAAAHDDMVAQARAKAVAAPTTNP